ncbi:choline-sulfatase [Phaeobacter gallaeciensis]|uniref:Choline-sulfatase BetC n=1 Tax=Phaeobacter gallaeciensis TaxID=60890 RepID=A0AAC9Z884_9RHOB|nr:choline-sulfatase [Phaeobacter gallaeciensis]AHD09002.1 choline-sulfatase [Phaeobacter gallaeciensis DSM 26640]ATE92268.1 choline-sulfatase BetC [Phaeobacter gallaeciensis]ATE97913.1 choline-sulfatase BetC [Phaeobacter gallaeciensis]ATF00930.1 choline-sulfatase BetC [Phaeobacter gallaeciensis]ATF05310.1 choline-sulfatase BetC [Phaeobacter gallaeciensis]
MTAPNILIVMVDQLNGTLFPDGPADFLHAPNLKKLAARSTRFKNAYTASPLCAPGRASFMSGQLPSRTGVYDNAAEFRSDIPTYAHHLRRAGYYTCLSGKMHFVGPDQMHGFEDRLTTDIYPADFGWTPDYRKPGERIDWWYHNMGSVTGAGVAEISNQMEYDDEVAYHAKAKLYDLARGKDDRPWGLTVSFTHPHDPYVARKKYWDLYEDCEHLLPEVPAMDYADHDNHSKRIFDANDWRSFDISQEDIKRSRRAYFANISYLDDKIGEILEVLETTRQEAIILFVSDHGDMLGERGLWFKMSFFEGSSRVPLMISAPNLPAGLIETPVSTLDVTPTLGALAGVDMAEIEPWTDGQNLLPLAMGTERSEPVAIEYAAEASYAPLVSLRYGKWKYNRCALDPDQLFDLEADPQELNNLADDPTHAGTLQTLRAKSEARWDLKRFDAEVRASQARRWVVYEALRQGGYYPWDYQPLQKASERYMRNHMDLNDVEEGNRFPRGE